MDLQLQEHPIQIFAVISHATVQKHRTLKLLLQPFRTSGIKYHWAFPVFRYQRKKPSLSTFHDGKALLKKKTGTNFHRSWGITSSLATRDSSWQIALPETSFSGLALN